MAIIYMITNTKDGKIYIGQTFRTRNARWKSHLAEARQGSNTYLHRAIRRHGEDAFTHQILEEVPDGQASEREIALIALHRSTNRTIGYNIAEGGTHAKHTPETRAVLSARMMGNKHGLGKTPSDAHRKKLSECKRGNSYATGCIRSPETRAKMSNAWIGRTVSPETCAKISASKKGVRMADEAIRRAAISRTGLKRSDETKNKMAESRRLWWERKKSTIIN